MSFGAAIVKTALQAASQALLDLARRALRIKAKPAPVPPRGKDLVHIDRQIESATTNFRGGDTQRLPVMRPPPLKPRRRP